MYLINAIYRASSIKKRKEYKTFLARQNRLIRKIHSHIHMEKKRGYVISIRKMERTIAHVKSWFSSFLIRCNLELDVSRGIVHAKISFPGVVLLEFGGRTQVFVLYLRVYITFSTIYLTLFYTHTLSHINTLIRFCIHTNIYTYK